MLTVIFEYFWILNLLKYFTVINICEIFFLSIHLKLKINKNNKCFFFATKTSAQLKLS